MANGKASGSRSAVHAVAKSQQAYARSVALLNATEGAIKRSIAPNTWRPAGLGGNSEQKP